MVLPWHLAKGLFAECNTWQTTHDIYSAGKRLFTECFLSGTRQILCRELKPMLDEKKQRDSVETVTARLPSVPDLTLGKPASTPGHSANLAGLPSVKSRALGKPAFFAECQMSDTRQRLAQNVQKLASLPSVKSWHSANLPS